MSERRITKILETIASGAYRWTCRCCVGPKPKESHKKARRAVRHKLKRKLIKHQEENN